MKRMAVLALAAAAIAPAFAGTDIGVSIGINQPGVYGRIDIGNVAPEVVYAQPVIIAPTPYARYQRPIYLYVPVAHQRDWGRYCGRYSACGQPVYFVQERWVRDRYEQGHPGGRDARRPPGHGDDRHEGRGNEGRGNEGNRGHGHDRRDDDRRD